MISTSTWGIFDMYHLFFFNTKNKPKVNCAFEDFKELFKIKAKKNLRAFLYRKPSSCLNCNAYNYILTYIHQKIIDFCQTIDPDSTYLYFISLNTLCSDPYQAISALQFLHDRHFHIFLIEYGLNQELTTVDIKNIKKEFTPRPSKIIHSEFLIRYLLSLHTVKNITFSKLEQTSGISENTLKYHSNKKSKTVDLAKPMVKATASKGKLSAQEQKMIKAMRHYNQLNEETADLWLPYIDEL